MQVIPIACQLFTLRDALQQDFLGTLKKVKSIGYDYAQISGPLPESGQHARELFATAGLTPVGVHIGLDQLRTDLVDAIEYCLEAGTSDLILPWLSESERKSPADWMHLACEIKEIATICWKHGIRFSYHNHDFEFVPVRGRFALDYILEKTDPELVYAEFDTYWIQYAGADPVEYIQRYAGRCPLLHVKDMGDDEIRSFQAIGKGILDWQAILSAAQNSGVEYLIVEQDVCPSDPFECLGESFEFLSALQADAAAK